MVGVGPRPQAGDIWFAGLDPDLENEPGGRRPVVVVSSPGLHSLPINTVVVVPLTGHDHGLVMQPTIAGGRTGLSRPSFARPEDVRSIDAGRLERRLGATSAEQLAEIRKVLRYFLDL